MKLKFTTILISCLLLAVLPNSDSQTQTRDAFKLLSLETQYTAGDAIVLRFSNVVTPPPELYVSHSLGTTVVAPKIKNEIVEYHIPQSMTKKAGQMYWRLISTANSMSGKLQIQPNNSITSLETYLGPPSIEAGGKDYTMLVVIPTDLYDNPLKDSTEVQVQHQFLARQYQDRVFTNTLISYQNIYSEIKSGRMLISSECLGLNSKEYDVNVMPAIATDFFISFHRHHDYADGNQVASFETDIIRDQYSNIVSDGTYVDFFIRNSKGNILKTSGTTINGIATAKMIHPDHEDSWDVTAYIEGIAKSKTITLSFRQAVSDFEVAFSEQNSVITVGPIKSFMHQMIPNGLEVRIAIYKDGALIERMSKGTLEGYTTFKLKKDRFPEGAYDMIIETAGKTITYQNVDLW